MKIKHDQRKTSYLYDTSIENLFICEYMVEAPGDYVKVYLYVLMETQMGNKISAEDISKRLRLSSDDVEKAFYFFQEMGALRKSEEGFLVPSLKEKLYGSQTEHTAPASSKKNSTMLQDNVIKEMLGEINQLTGRFLSTQEISEILNWIDVYGANTEVIRGAYAFSVKKKKDNVRYVEAIVKDWTRRGLYTKQDIDQHLKSTDERFYSYSRIMKALGFSRNPTEEERRKMDSWFDDLSLDMKQVLAACAKTSGTSNPNINYVNAILQKNEKKGTSRNLVMKYYEKLRNDALAKSKSRKEEVYDQVPQVLNIDEQLIECSQLLSRTLIGGGVDKGEQIAEIRSKASRLDDEKTIILTEKGIPVDYMDIQYLCNSCKDTGTKDSGERCTCYKERAAEAEAWSKLNNA